MVIVIFFTVNSLPARCDISLFGYYVRDAVDINIFGNKIAIASDICGIFTVMDKAFGIDHSAALIEEAVFAVLGLEEACFLAVFLSKVVFFSAVIYPVELLLTCFGIIVSADTADSAPTCFEDTIIGKEILFTADSLFACNSLGLIVVVEYLSVLILIP